MTGGCHTLAACMASVQEELEAHPAEQMLDLRSLVGKTVRTIGRYQFGWRMTFTDGTVIFVIECQTFDAAGNFVREP